MRLPRIATLFVTALLLAAPALADEITLNFDERFPTGIPRTPDGSIDWESLRFWMQTYSHGGVTIDGGFGATFVSLRSAAWEADFEEQPLLYQAGTGVLLAPVTTRIMASGSRFIVNSIDFTSPRWNHMYHGPSSMWAHGYVDGVIVGSVPVFVDPWYGNWTHADLSGLGAIDTLALISINQQQGYAYYMDNVRVSTVPEPSTLLLIGLGGMACLTRMRRVRP